MGLIYFIYSQLQLTENFENAPAQSLGGIDDTNAINTLAQIAKNLMAGGVTVPGNMKVNGDISTGEGKVSINNGTINLHSDGGGGLYFLKSGNVGKEPVFNKLFTGDLVVNGGNLTTPVLNLGNKFRLSGVGESHNNDKWLRILDVNNKDYYGGLAAGKLWTADGTINDRNLFAEIDVINNKKIIITHAQYGTDLITTGVALNHEAHKANSNGSYAFDYKIGTEWNGNGYDPQPHVRKGFFCAFKCGLNGNVQQIGRGGEAGGQVIRIAC